MVLAIGKLTILIGAGAWVSDSLFGSVLAKEGHMPSVYDLFSGTSKVLKLIKSDEKSTSNPKPLSDALLAQVNSIRQELQLLASDRPVTIITSSGGTTRNYGIIIIVAVTGYAYVLWKGWKLPDMMFATRGSLSDATNAVAKQLETVHSSFVDTKRHLSSRIDRVDCSLDEVAEVTTSTQEEASRMNIFTLKQDETNLGVGRLILNDISLENQPLSLPPVQIEELKPSPPESPKDFKDVAEEARNTPQSSSGLNIADGSSSSSVFGRTFSGLNSVFSRTQPLKRHKWLTLSLSIFLFTALELNIFFL
ncbi:hypothetical protein QVD17_40724 [Tagetes erecta]|uniref:DUF1664 domain-containing protein n=1 Tax=Tagetes erecta TaxID=13708 RepID=A0AAD8JS73_TARER|nr:hypothetical protein QVD17_40724 [Tagetes erecta]